MEDAALKFLQFMNEIMYEVQLENSDDPKDTLSNLTDNLLVHLKQACRLTKTWYTTKVSIS
jgi:ferritin